MHVDCHPVMLNFRWMGVAPARWDAAAPPQLRVMAQPWPMWHTVGAKNKGF
ncbi:MAG TPA: hypothetical protein VJA94_25400 [Candidatus Angelobacter sp.]